MAVAIDPRSSELNYVVVNGVQSPGRATLTGVKTPYKWNIQEAYGLAGASTTFVGRGIAKFTLTITLWLPEHFVAWAVFSKLLEPPTPGKPLVVKMRHPLLSAAGIVDVSVESFGQPERQTNGMWIATIQMLEFRPFVPAIVKPRGAIPAPAKGTPITPKTEADKALAELDPRFAAARDAARR